MTATREEEFAIYPTVIGRAEPDRIGFVTATQDGDEALIVFRSPEEADRFREYTGRYGSEEGYRLLRVDVEEISCVLEVQGLSFVAFPEPWTGYGGIDLFTAENFLRFLEECREG